jgi:exo-beta-1,3-glucanase (GH17 family)
VAPGAAARDRNRAQVEGAARLAEAYPGVVLAVVVGNETQVSWSAFRSPAPVLIGWIREARRLTAKPVATADDFLWWLTPESEAVAREVDFMVTHVHPLWNGRRLEEALAFTQEKVRAMAARHPGLPQLLGETGWATRRAPVGDQATLIKAVPDEAQQVAFLQAFTAWATAERLPFTWFEAFDENWKGGPHPDEVEKHWGLWRADRSPKPAALTPLPPP